MREKNPRSVIDQKHTEQRKRLETTRENHMSHNKLIRTTADSHWNV